LSPQKCEALCITNKRKPVMFTYFINGQPVHWTNLVKYLQIHINGKLQWSGHCQTVASKATRVLNILRCSMFGCNSEVKCRAYKTIVRPLLEYACVVWSPHTMKDMNLLEAVQRRAAHWACSSSQSGLNLMMITSCVYHLCVPDRTTCRFCSPGYSSH